jgi:hypothetical protein
MSEFKNRIDAQRRILHVVNGSLPLNEELFGLSSGALERWIAANQFRRADPLVVLLYEAADRLFFLSNKSQEQITEEYQRLSDEIGKLTDLIRKACSSGCAPANDAG